MDKILILVWIKAHFKEMSNVALTLKEQPDYSVQMVFAENLKKDDQILSFCEQNDFAAFFLNDEFFIEKIVTAGPISFTKKVGMKFILNSAPFFLCKLIYRKYLAKKLLKKLQPNLIIFPYLGIGGIEDYVNYWAHKKTIPTIVIPYAWNPASEQWVARKSLKIFNVTALYKLLVPFLRRQWDLKGILYQPVYKILPLEFIKGSVLNPWNGDTSADVIFLESFKMKDLFISEKGNEFKIRMTGSLSQDLVYKYSREANMVPSVPFVLFAVPPDQTGNQIAGFEFKNYEDLILKWVSLVADQQKYEIILSIHPREKLIKNKLKNISGISIYEGDILTLLPHCELFICSISGLVRTTALLNISTIYYDCFHYNLMEYIEVQSVKYAFSFSQFNELYKSFLQTETVPTRQGKINHDWGYIDGKSKLRILEEIKKIIK